MAWLELCVWLGLGLGLEVRVKFLNAEEDV